MRSLPKQALLGEEKAVRTYRLGVWQTRLVLGSGSRFGPQVVGRDRGRPLHNQIIQGLFNCQTCIPEGRQRGEPAWGTRYWPACLGGVVGTWWVEHFCRSLTPEPQLTRRGWRTRIRSISCVLTSELSGGQMGGRQRQGPVILYSSLAPGTEARAVHGGSSSCA